MGNQPATDEVPQDQILWMLVGCVDWRFDHQLTIAKAMYGEVYGLTEVGGLAALDDVDINNLLRRIGKLWRTKGRRPYLGLIGGSHETCAAIDGEQTEDIHYDRQQEIMNKIFQRISTGGSIDDLSPVDIITRHLYFQLNGQVLIGNFPAGRFVPLKAIIDEASSSPRLEQELLKPIVPERVLRQPAGAA